MWQLRSEKNACASIPITLVVLMATGTRVGCGNQPEIMAGRYFGGLLKICHLAEFTLAVEAVLAIIIFIAKWLIERSGNLTWL